MILKSCISCLLDLGDEDGDKDNKRAGSHTTTTAPIAIISSPTVIRSFEVFANASGVQRLSLFSLGSRKSFIESQTVGV